MDPVLDPTNPTDHDIVSEPSLAETQKQRWFASVSLESETNPVLLWRGEIEASTPALAAKRAVLAARKAFPGKQARSWALVIEKR